MKITISLLVILIVLPICSSAQSEKNDTTLVANQNNNKIIEIHNNGVVELEKQVRELSDIVTVLTESENNLKGKLFNSEQKIKEQDSIIKKIESRLLFTDTIVALISNNCLLRKYDPKDVDDAINYFERMYSDNMKRRLSRLKVLLEKYGSYTLELEKIFIEAENDKALRNPFTGQKQAMTYIDKIKATHYYIEAYDENWTIPYLNTVIDKCIETIGSFNPKESKELHLIELMK